MKIDFAPMEGVTDFVFRKTFNKYFKGVSRYYTPFLSPAPKRILAQKELREVVPENNEGMELIPQLLTNNAEDFNLAAGKLYEMGYNTINLNLGCPSGTVTAKGKGSGFLKYPDELEEFLYKIFGAADYNISIKSRIGVKYEEEWETIMRIYEKFPLSELILHPRLMKEQYRGTVHASTLKTAYLSFGNKLTCNGDIKSIEDIKKISDDMPNCERIMIGRGLISDPFLAEKSNGYTHTDRRMIKEFASELFMTYIDEFKSEHAAVNRMKGIWFYLINSFDNYRKNSKLIKKASNAVELNSAVMQIE